MKRKFFCFGSPASFSKELDAELLGFGGGAEKRRRRNFFLFFFYISGRLCPTQPNADGKKELPF
jgi:hypothetical protein